METARLSGKQIGAVSGKKLNVKKAAPAKELIKKYSKDFDGTLTDAEAMKLIGISNNTYYKYKREMKEAINNNWLSNPYRVIISVGIFLSTH